MAFAARSRSLTPCRLAAAAALALALCGAPALAQTEVHGPVQRPPRQQPVPMKMTNSDETAQTTRESTEEGAHKGKFPNKDTAKNRKDYEMGTDAGADTITLGREEGSGDTVATHKPKKQEQQQNPYSTQPIEIKPIVPVGGWGSHSGGSGR